MHRWDERRNRMEVHSNEAVQSEPLVFWLKMGLCTEIRRLRTTSVLEQWHSAATFIFGANVQK